MRLGIGWISRSTPEEPQTGAWTYGCDANNRLDWALAPNFAASGDPTRPVPGQPAGGDYEYDWVGNRVRPPADPGPVSDMNKMVYNDADQLLMWPGRHGRWNGSTLVPGRVARVHPTQGIRYYHFDELGSTRLLTNSNGDITDRYAYDAYGSLLSRDRYTGSVNQPYQYVGRLGYYTHWMEPDFTLLQLGVRFYDAEVGGLPPKSWTPQV